MVTGKNYKLVSQVVTYIILIVFTIYCVFPFLWMLSTSIKPIDEIRTAIPTFFTSSPTLENFRRVLITNGFLINIKNSLIIAIFTTFASLIISVFAGYAFSRYGRYKGVKVSSVFMLVTQMIPGVLLLVPLYIIMQRLQLLNTYRALIIAYTTFLIPLCTFILKGFFDTLPYDLEEAAEIDGCSKLGIIFRIILPVSIPSLISAGLYAFITAWNEFMFGFIFVSSDAARTITPAIVLFKGANLTDWGGLMAASTLAVIPVAIIFLFLQKYFISGMTSGAVK